MEPRMRSLFQLLWRNNFLITFLILEGFSFYFLVQNNKFHNASVLNSANKVTARIYEGVNYVQEYIHLKTNNENLAGENAMLRSSLPDAFYNNSFIRKTVRDTSLLQQYSYIMARVINNSVNKRNNYLTLDKGSLHGIEPEMGVISSTGVVGIVKDVSPHYCTVMSVLHKDTRISTRLKKSAYFGSLEWDGQDPTEATLKQITTSTKIAKGDSLVTTTYSSIFPQDILVGTVKDFSVKPGESFYTIRVKLSSDFSSLSFVYIVGNVLKREQLELEHKSTKENAQ
jgi:rod shape-determining protein MreC